MGRPATQEPEQSRRSSFLRNHAPYGTSGYARKADLVLKRDYFGTHRQEWPDGPGAEFHLAHGDWFRNLHDNGFEVTDLIEVRPGPDAATTYPWVTLDWARRWPVEEVWKARKR